MTRTIVEGTVFTIGKTNANGWAIPDEEVENAITSLKGAVVRVCNSRDEHSCDREGSRWDEIGHVVDAWREGDAVKARAVITDSEAARRIREGTWKPTWSLFGTGHVENGYVHDLFIEALTLVRRPAYEEAEFTLVECGSTPEQVVVQLDENVKERHAKTIVEAMLKVGALTPEEAETTREHLMELPESALSLELSAWQRAAVFAAESKLDTAELSDVGASGLTVGRWDNSTKQWIVH